VSQKTILLVEDNEDNRFILATQLRRMEGVIIIEAQHGQEALDVIAQRQPDLLILDLHLPGLDGWTVIRRIRAMDSAVKDLPIIAITGQSMPQDAQDAFVADYDEYISKPLLDFNIIREKIDRLLTHGKSTRERC
jgi:CheY-like chemotaxis protein